jgi:hypothetical protein
VNNTIIPGFGHKQTVINNLVIDSTTIRTAYKSPLYYAYEHMLHFGVMPAHTMKQMTYNRKTGKPYVIFGWATTDTTVSGKVRNAVLDAKAMILDMESAKIKTRNPNYEPIWMSMAKHREEVQERKNREMLNNDDLPF